MLKTQILKTVFFTALSLNGLLLLYLFFVVHPAYKDLLIENSEDEAVRYVSFLVHAYKLDQKPLEVGQIPAEVADDIGKFDQDAELIKLRVFDPAGEIIFSTIPKEVGQINQNDYFHKIVAAGEIYSKSVSKDNFTAEHEVVKTDLVETYVPIIGNDEFHGAVETYFDVTKSTVAIRDLTTHSLSFLAVVSSLLLYLLYYALRHADKSIIARLQAESELRKANEELEVRVAERAGELIRVNRELRDEVAERTLAQTALKQSLFEMEDAKGKIDGILRSVSDGLLVLDQNENIILMNKPAEEIVGASLKSVAGKSIHDLELPVSLENALVEILKTTENLNVDFELPRPVPERPRIFQIRTSVLRGIDNSSLGIVILMQDVSFEREIDQMKSNFLAMAAHELMTPLTAIMGYSELLGSDNVKQLTEEQKNEFLNYIHRKAENLSCIVDDLLDLSRIEAGQEISIAKMEFDLISSVHRILESFRENNSSYKFVFNKHCDNCHLFADPIRIEQVIENILSNAVKYSSPGTEIKAGCISDKQNCQFEVVDQGIGMTAEHVAHIFDQFYRVDISDTAKQGVGLGMSIAKHIVDAHNGTIIVESHLGQGTRVMFSLPKN